MKKTLYPLEGGGHKLLGQGREAGQPPADGAVHGVPEHGDTIGVGPQGAAQLQQALHRAGKKQLRGRGTTSNSVIFE